MMEKLLKVPQLRQFFDNQTKGDIVALNSSVQGLDVLQESKRLQELNESPLAIFRVQR